jgi:hypothetical protein
MHRINGKMFHRIQNNRIWNSFVESRSTSRVEVPQMAQEFGFFIVVTIAQSYY